MNPKKLPRVFIFLLVLLFLFALPFFFKQDYWLYIFCLAGINVILVMSLHTIARTGEILLGTAGFMAVGAYTSAILSMKMGLSVWLSMFLGGASTTVVALILGYFFLRAKGIYFSILTLIASEVFRLIVWYATGLTGGAQGLSRIPSPEPIKIFGATIAINTKTDYYYLFLVIILVVLFILYRLQSSQIGFTWRAIRERDNLAKSVGINIMSYKMLAFAIGCFFIGIAGAMFAHFMHLLSADVTGRFGSLTSIYVLIYMVVGGEAIFAGPVIGALLLTILPEVARPLREYLPIVFGALVIVVIFVMPKGLISLPERLVFWVGKVRGSRIKSRG